MKNGPRKGSQKISQTVYPVQVAGIPRSCTCGNTVRRGIMWEYGAVLYCSKLCATTEEQRDIAVQQEQASEQD